MRKSVYIHTFGCQMNVHDSEKMLGILGEKGFDAVQRPEDADLIIYNTCAIRDKAEQKFFSHLGRTKLLKRRRDVKIAVAGCIAQDAKEKIFSKAPFVDYLVGPQNIHQLSDMLEAERGVHLEENPGIGSIAYAPSRASRSRAWVSIMYGCNNFCSYCIVPYTRGREISRPSADVLSEIRTLKDSGYREVTLLGQNVNSYSSDIGFVGLLRAIDSIGIGRVRFVTSHPRDFGEDLIESFHELQCLCEHIHLPLQSGSDRILKAMNRGYSYHAYREKIERLRTKIPHVAVTTDIIVGFPGETDDDYHATLNALREIEYDGVFAFQYSPRRGTGAAAMKGRVPDQTKRERLNALLKIQDDITLKKNKLLENTRQEILVEGPSDSDQSLLMGRTRTNKIVTLPEKSHAEGECVQVRIDKARHHSLHGTCLCHS